MDCHRWLRKKKILPFLLLGLLALLLAGCIGTEYTVRDLSGTYRYNLIELRTVETAPEIDYCDEYGTAVADGAGHLVASGTRKCSVTGSATDSHDHTYTVAPDGTVLVTEVGASESTRGQIVDGGKILLIDGTTRGPGILVMHGVAVREHR